ncbi:hypothetical protein LXL04_038616 [Taraxacum kok-saghyz]
MESGGNGGAGFPNYVNLHKHPLAPPPLTTIGRFLQGQSLQNHFHHNFENNGFSSCSNAGIGGLYDEYEVPLVPSLSIDKFLDPDYGVFSSNYRNIELSNQVLKSGKKIMKSKGCGRKSLIKGQWTKEENRKWAHIAEQMIGRAGKQCRERWHNHLRPHIKNCDVTPPNQEFGGNVWGLRDVIQVSQHKKA